jgi:hypothetical protein
LCHNGRMAEWQNGRMAEWQIATEVKEAATLYDERLASCRDGIKGAVAKKANG